MADERDRAICPRGPTRSSPASRGMPARPSCTIRLDETESGGRAMPSDRQPAIADRFRARRARSSPSQAGEKARGLVSQGLERSAEALANVAKMVGDTAPGIEERLGPEYGDYARRAAAAIENAANAIADEGPRRADRGHPQLRPQQPRASRSPARRSSASSSPGWSRPASPRTTMTTRIDAQAG